MNENIIISIAFVIFLYYTYRPIKAAILKSLDDKIDQIKKQYAESENLKKDAIKILKQAENELKDFDRKKQALLEEAKDNVEKIIAEKSAEIERQHKIKQDDLLNQMEVEYQRNNQILYKEFSTKAINLVEKYLSKTNNNNCKAEDLYEHLSKNES